MLTNREHVIALEARHKGLMGMLRYPYEVRDAAAYFDDILDVKIPKDMLDLAGHIVETKAGQFDPAKFEDRYEAALQESLEKKDKGQPRGIRKDGAEQCLQPDGRSLSKHQRRSAYAGRGAGKGRQEIQASQAC